MQTKRTARSESNLERERNHAADAPKRIVPAPASPAASRSASRSPGKSPSAPSSPSTDRRRGTKVATKMGRVSSAKRPSVASTARTFLADQTTDRPADQPEPFPDQGRPSSSANSESAQKHRPTQNQHESQIAASAKKKTTRLPASRHASRTSQVLTPSTSLVKDSRSSAPASSSASPRPARRAPAHVRKRA